MSAEVLVVSGSGQGKLEMAAAALTEKGYVLVVHPGFLVGEGSEGSGGREVEEVLVCRVRKAQRMWGQDRR